MYLIDGYNLLHALKNAHPGQFPRAFRPGRERMLHLLSAFAKSHNTTVTAYFDGNSGPLEPGELALAGVRVRFCGPGDQTADKAICMDVETGASRNMTVVSSDREVRTFCRNEGALVESSEQFLSRLGGGSDRPSTSARPDHGPARDDHAAPAKPKSRPQRRQKATPPDGKPSGGHIGEIERKMLDEIGNLDDLEREIMDE